MFATYGLPPDLRVLGEAQPQAEYWHLPSTVWGPLHARATGKGMIIAVLDTGYNPRHPLLKTPLATRSFVGTPHTAHDDHGHGSHCAGIACRRNGSITPAPGADLIVGKVLDKNGSGSDDGIIQAVHWATDEIAKRGVGFISLSLGGSGPPNSAMIAALKYALSHGVQPVVAAGNSGYNPGADTIGEPARREEVLCIGAMGRNGSIAGFSSAGRAMDFAVPGEKIVSCGHRNDEMVEMSGTSMACPYAAAFCAVVQELHLREGKPWLRGIEAWRQFFSKNTDDKGVVGPDPRYGYGVPRYTDIVRALAADDIIWV